MGDEEHLQITENTEVQQEEVIKYTPGFAQVFFVPGSSILLSAGAVMKQIIEGIESLTPKLQELESQMAKGDLKGKSANDLLGSNPQLGFSKLVEFKAALDRMRSLTWVYMEAAATAGRLPAQRIPHSLREFLQQQASKTHIGQAKKSR